MREGCVHDQRWDKDDDWSFAFRLLLGGMLNEALQRAEMSILVLYRFIVCGVYES